MGCGNGQDQRSNAIRRASDLRRDWRSRPQEDFPGALRNGQNRCPEGAGRRRCLFKLDSDTTARTGKGQYRALRECRPSNPEPVSLVAALRTGRL